MSTDIIQRDKVIEYLQAFGLAGDLNKNETEQFCQIAMAYNLNPFKREIYCVAYGQGNKRKLSIITGYETYLKRAERVGTLKGWKAWTEGEYKIEDKKVELQGSNGPYTKVKRLPVGNLVAKVQIHRAGWDVPFEHEVYLDEYAQDNEMWANKTRTMLKKVAIAQGFRMAFPDEIGGMPYAEEEIDESMRDVSPEKVTKPKELPANEKNPEAKPTEAIEEKPVEQPVDPWPAQWKERAMKLSDTVKTIDQATKNKLEIKRLATEAQTRPGCMDVAELRVALFMSGTPTDKIVSFGEDLIALEGFAKSLNDEPEAPADDQLF